MSSRPWLLSTIVAVLTIAAARAAHAQAPGDQAGFAVPVAPVCDADVAVPSPIAAVMARRWAIALTLGGTTLAPSNAPDAQTQFSIGELALRFRATPHVELELAAGGGQAKTDADLALHAVTAAVRYRLRPGHAWDWYLLAGIGAMSVASAEATSDELHAATRGEVFGGVGVERRFGSFGLTAELRAIAIAPPSAPAQMTAEPVAATASQAPVSTAPSSTTVGESGGQLTFGAAYYF